MAVGVCARWLAERGCRRKAADQRGEITERKFSKGLLMSKTRYRALALPAIVLGISLSSGCGTANEESMADTKRAPTDPSAPVFKTYGEKALYDAEQAKKKAAEKGKGAKTAAPAPARPLTPRLRRTSPSPSDDRVPLVRNRASDGHRACCLTSRSVHSIIIYLSMRAVLNEEKTGSQLV